MSDVTTDSKLTFILISDMTYEGIHKYFFKKFNNVSWKSNGKAEKLNEKSSLFRTATQVEFIHSLSRTTVTFLSIHNVNKFQTIELMQLTCQLTQTCSVSGFLFAMDDIKACESFSGFENQAKCLQVLFEKYDLDIFICPCQYKEKYDIIYTHRKEILEKILEANYKIFNVELDIDSLQEALLASRQKHSLSLSASLKIIETLKMNEIAKYQTEMSFYQDLIRFPHYQTNQMANETEYISTTQNSNQMSNLEKVNADTNPSAIQNSPKCLNNPNESNSFSDQVSTFSVLDKCNSAKTPQNSFTNSSYHKKPSDTTYTPTNSGIANTEYISLSANSSEKLMPSTKNTSCIKVSEPMSVSNANPTTMQKKSFAKDTQQTSDSIKIQNENAVQKTSNYINTSYKNDCKEFNYLVLGETGSGKTTLINYLANYFEGCINIDEVFDQPDKFQMAIPEPPYWTSSVIERFCDMHPKINPSQSKMASQTSQCNEFKFNLNRERDKITFIDTPGFNDTSGITTDESNLFKIKQACAKIKHLNGVLLVVNGSQSRQNISTISWIMSFFQLVPDELRQKTLLVLTNCQSAANCNFVYNRSIEAFFMQNNILKWNRKVLSSQHKINFAECWKDSYDAIDSMLKKLIEFKPVDTKLFAQISEIERNVELNIREVLKKRLLYLFSLFFDIKNKHKAVLASLATMKSNMDKYKVFTTEAIPFEQPKVRPSRIDNQSHYSRSRSSYPYSSNSTMGIIGEDLVRKNIPIKLDDNASKYKYAETEKQCDKLLDEIKKSENIEKTTMAELDNVLKTLTEKTRILRKINTKYNFAVNFADDLYDLKQMVEKKLTEAPELAELVDKVFGLFK